MTTKITGLKGLAFVPYLLRGMEVVRPNQVWARDITYIPMARGYVKHLRRAPGNGFADARDERPQTRFLVLGPAPLCGRCCSATAPCYSRSVHRARDADDAPPHLADRTYA